MNDQDAFSQYRPGYKAQTNVSQESEAKDLFKNYRPKQDTGVDVAKRVAAQTVARPIEAISSVPGNLLRFISDYGITAAEKISGKNLQGAREALEDTAAFKLFPTSEQAKKVSAKISGGLTEPKTEAERTYNDVLELGTFLTTAMENPRNLAELGRKLGLAVGVTGAKKTSKALGAGEIGQAATELGSLVLGSMYNPRAITEYLGKQFKNLRSSPISQRIVPTDTFSKSLDKIESTLKHGGTGPSGRAALPKLEELKEIAAKSNVPLDELLEGYVKIGEEISARDLYDKLGKEGARKLRHNYDEMKDAISQTVKEYTPKEYYKEWEDIKQAYSTYAKSRRVADWVNRNKNMIVKSVGPGLIGDLYLSLGATGPAISAATAGFAAKEIGEVIARITRSPRLREYYLDSLAHISKENGPAAIASMKKLQKALDEDEKRK